MKQIALGSLALAVIASTIYYHLRLREPQMWSTGCRFDGTMINCSGWEKRREFKKAD